jgi:cytochrome c553
MKKKCLLLSILLPLVIIVIFGLLYLQKKGKDVKSSIVLHYEVGKQQGSQVCADCHPQTYEEWAQNSSHIESTTSQYFLESVDKIKNNFILNKMFFGGL